MACIKKSVIEFLNDDYLFGCFKKPMQVTETICLYNFNDIRVAQYWSSSKKSMIFILSRNKGNLLKVRVEPHFVQRFEERVSPFKVEGFISIISNIFFNYIGSYNSDPEHVVKILYPLKRNCCCIKIVANEHKSEIVFKTCYKRRYKDEKVKLEELYP